MLTENDEIQVILVENAHDEQKRFQKKNGFLLKLQ